MDRFANGVKFIVLHKDGEWYLVQCKPRESFRAEMHLINQGHTCFHPTHIVKRKIAGRVQWMIAPLFAHYLFVLLNDTDNWSTIRSTRGVNKMVYFGSRPAYLEHHFITALQRECAKLHGEALEPLYKVGERVLVMEGCFKEIEAIVTATDGDERVTLLLNLFNRPQYVELSTQAVVGI